MDANATTGTCNQNNKLVSIALRILKVEVHQTVNNDDLEINFETSRIGKKVVNFEHVDFA